MNNKSHFTLTYVLVVIVLVGALIAGCAQAPAVNAGTIVGSGKVTSETRDVSGFTSIVFSGPGYLIISQGDAESLSIQAEDNILTAITTTVTDGVLEIGITPDSTLQNTSMIQYTLVVKDLNSIQNNGSGYISAGGLTLTDFAVKSSGSGSARFAGTTAANMTIELTGTGSFDIDGTADTLALTSSGSSVFNGANLAVKSATVSITGSGSATVDASESLDATITGSGSLVYLGTPEITQNITGSGTISAQ